MKKNSIISLLLKDDQVNLYTKLFIFLYYKNQNSDFLITNELICKYLKLDNSFYNKKKIYFTLKQLEDNKVIKVKIRHRRRFFKWLLDNDIDKMFTDRNIFVPDYDWLNEVIS